MKLLINLCLFIWWITLIRIKREKLSLKENEKKEKEAKARKEINSGGKMDCIRGNNVGSVCLAKETLTIKMHIDAQFDLFLRYFR
jgi:hypothetical protein